MIHKILQLLLLLPFFGLAQNSVQNIEVVDEHQHQVYVTSSIKYRDKIIMVITVQEEIQRSRIQCIDTLTNVIWEREFDYASSIRIFISENGLLYIHKAPPILPQGYNLFCLNPETGDTIWEVELPRTGGSNLINDLNNNELIIVTDNSTIQIIDKNDGTLLRQKSHTSSSLVNEERRINFGPDNLIFYSKGDSIQLINALNLDTPIWHIKHPQIPNNSYGIVITRLLYSPIDSTLIVFSTNTWTLNTHYITQLNLETGELISATTIRTSLQIQTLTIKDDFLYIPYSSGVANPTNDPISLKKYNLRTHQMEWDFTSALNTNRAVYLSKIEIDSNSNIYCTGAIRQNSDYRGTWYVAKISPEGELLYTKSMYNSVPNDSRLSQGLAIHFINDIPYFLGTIDHPVPFNLPKLYHLKIEPETGETIQLNTFNPNRLQVDNFVHKMVNFQSDKVLFASKDGNLLKLECYDNHMTTRHWLTYLRDVDSDNSTLNILTSDTLIHVVSKQLDSDYTHNTTIIRLNEFGETINPTEYTSVFSTNSINELNYDSFIWNNESYLYNVNVVNQINIFKPYPIPQTISTYSNVQSPVKMKPLDDQKCIMAQTISDHNNRPVIRFFYFYRAINSILISNLELPGYTFIDFNKLNDSVLLIVANNYATRSLSIIKYNHIENTHTEHSLNLLNFGSLIKSHFDLTNNKIYLLAKTNNNSQPNRFYKIDYETYSADWQFAYTSTRSNFYDFHLNNSNNSILLTGSKGQSNTKPFFLELDSNGIINDSLTIELPGYSAGRYNTTNITTSNRKVTTGGYTNPQGHKVGLITVLNPFTIREDTVTSCQEYHWPIANTTYTTSGVYEFIEGDTLNKINLTINPVHDSTITISSCTEFTWNQTNRTYTRTGIYSDTLINQFGCDSILFLNLTIRDTSLTVINQIACDSFTWNLNNVTYLEPGEYDYILSNQNGCDSTIRLNLLLHPEIMPAISNIFSSPTAPDSCNGRLAITLEGIPPFTVTINNDRPILMESNYQLISNLCQGIHSIEIQTFCNLSTTNQIVIPTDSNYIFNNTFIDSIYRDSLGSVYENCEIYYNGITDAYIDSIWNSDINEVTVIWNIISNGVTEQITTIHNPTNGDGIYVLQVNLYCTYRSLGNFATITETILYQNGLPFLKVENLNNNNLYNLFPNPTTDRIQLNSSSTDPLILIVYDITGKELFTKTIFTGIHEISLNNYSSGVYLFEVHYLGKKDICRIIKQ